MEEWLRKPNPTPEPDLFILPGVPTGSEDPDVMRVEETQIFGAVSMGNHGLFCLPDTHSKWATVDKKIFSSFKTYLTGEIYALARQVAVKKVAGPGVKREAVAHLRSVTDLSERRACSIVDADRTMIGCRHAPCAGYSPSEATAGIGR